MPFSTVDTHPFMSEYILKRCSKLKKKKIKILDCGVGGGLIAKSITDFFHNSPIQLQIDGVEIFGDYIKNQDLIEKLRQEHGIFHNLYNKIHIAPFHKHLKEMKTKYDFIIFGDSLEHCYPDIAESSLAYAIKKCNYAVMINIPIKPLKQGTVYGNIYETHLLEWKRETLEAFGCEYMGGDGTVAAFFLDVAKWKKSKNPIPKTISDQDGKYAFKSNGDPN